MIGSGIVAKNGQYFSNISELGERSGMLPETGAKDVPRGTSRGFQRVFHVEHAPICGIAHF
jgi:hypothetical protein